MSNLYIIIPAYNEQANIEAVAREWHQVVEKAGGERSKLIVIDDGSKDDTFEILQKLSRQLGRLYPIRKENSGHGATVLFGYQLAIKEKADYVFQTDSDGQTVPDEFDGLWAHRDDYDAIIGHRQRRQDGFSRIVVTKVLKLVLLLIFGVRITDANTPFRLMKRELLERHIQKVPADFNLTNVLLTVSFIKNKEKVTFMPITFRPRQGGINSINIKRIFGIGLQAVKDFRVINKQTRLHAEGARTDLSNTP
jgi:glycosyltransferase involved in cell wall biosynthesis